MQACQSQTHSLYTLKEQYLREATCKSCRQDLCPLVSKPNWYSANLKLVSVFLLIHFHSQLIKTKHTCTPTQDTLLNPYTPLSQQLLPAAPNCGCQMHQKHFTMTDGNTLFPTERFNCPFKVCKKEECWWLAAVLWFHQIITSLPWLLIQSDTASQCHQAWGYLTPAPGPDLCL